MTILLNNTGNPITREERIKINENWDRIVSGLTKLQFQINILAGGQEVDDILKAIEDAIKRANEAQVKADEAVIKAKDAVVKSEEAIVKANTSAQNADTKAKEAENTANDAKQATQDALNALDKVNIKIIEMNKSLENSKDTTDASKKVTQDALDTIAIAQTEIINAKDATQKALDTTLKANKVAEELKGYGTAEVWNNNKSYIKNNIVTFNGSTWQTVVPNKNSQPDVNNFNWILLAQRGVDGTGSVGSVNGFMPDENGNVNIPLTGGTVRSINSVNPDGAGNVTITADDLGSLSGSLLEDGTVSLEKLGQDVQDAINNAGEKIDIIDNLDSERSDAVLSAKQGNVLKNSTDDIIQTVSNLEQTVTKNNAEVTEHLAECNQVAVFNPAIVQSLASGNITNVIFAYGIGETELARINDQGKLQIRKTGTYLIIVSASFAHNPNGIRLTLLDNEVVRQNATSSSGTATSQQLSVIKKITSVNTNINIQVYQDSGVAIDLSAATNVKVVKVG